MHRPRFLASALAVLLASAAFSPLAAQQKPAAVQSSPDQGTRKSTEELDREAELRIANFDLPEGVSASLVVDEAQTQNPSAICFDEKGRLYIAEIHRWRDGVEDIRRQQHMLLDDISAVTNADRLAMYEKHADTRPLSYYEQYSDRILIATDENGDGRADRTHVYADDFDDALDGPGIGLVARDGAIYYTNIPHLWKLDDSDGDGVADRRQSLQDGFGPRMSFSGHDMHGLIWGMDGRLYWSIGDRGFTFTTQEGRYYERPNEGAVFRCDPDGSNVEVYYWGLRNPQELAVDAYGNLFTCDNDADAWDTGRLVYLIEGGHAGWTAGHQTLLNFRDPLNLRTPDYDHPGHKRIPMNPWMTEALWDTRHDGQPAWILPPVAKISWGPSGMVYNYGATALPERYAEHFFVCNFGGSRGDLESWTVEPLGAGFEAVDHHVFMTGAGNTDVEFGPDGRMYLSCFNNNGWVKQDIGNIYALFDPEAGKRAIVKETRDLLEGRLETLPSDQLAELLVHLDLRVRQRAQFELADRGDEGTTAFRKAVADTGALLPRLHGIWGLSMQARQRPELLPDLLALVEDEDAEVRAQATKMLADARWSEAGTAMVTLLQDPSPRVRSFAAIGVGKCRNPQGLAGLLTLLEENADQDATLRHAAVMGLWYLNEREKMLKEVDHPSAAVRLGVLLTLRRLEDPRVQYFLEDDDAAIRAEAIRAINDLDLQPALPALAVRLERLTRAQSPAPADHRAVFLHTRVINANFRLGGVEEAARVLNYASRPDLPEIARDQALAAIEEWRTPTPVDPTVGLYRPLVAENRAIIDAIVQEKIGAILESAEGALLARSLRVAVQYGADIPLELLTRQLENSEATPAVRVQAIRTLLTESPDTLKPRLEQLTNDPTPKIRAEAIAALLQLDPDLGHRSAFALSQSDELADRQNAYALLLKIEGPEVEGFFASRLQGLLDGEEPAGSQLDLLEAAEQRPEPSIAEKLAAWKASLDPADMLAPFTVAREGGDPAEGFKLYLTHAAGQCNKCHRVGGDGGIAGPDLTDVGKRHDRDYILESLVNPSAVVVPGYGITLFTLEDGSSLGATVLDENDEHVILKMPEGDEQILEHSKITARQPPVSAMPPVGFLMTKRELRDLVAYLAELKGTPFTGH